MSRQWVESVGSIWNPSEGLGLALEILNWEAIWNWPPSWKCMSGSSWDVPGDDLMYISHSAIFATLENLASMDLPTNQTKLRSYELYHNELSFDDDNLTQFCHHLCSRATKYAKTKSPVSDEPACRVDSFTAEKAKYLLLQMDEKSLKHWWGIHFINGLWMIAWKFQMGVFLMPECKWVRYWKVGNLCLSHTSSDPLTSLLAKLVPNSFYGNYIWRQTIKAAKLLGEYWKSTLMGKIMWIVFDESIVKKVSQPRNDFEGRRQCPPICDTHGVANTSRS